MSNVVKFPKREDSIEETFACMKDDKTLDSVIIIGRNKDRELVWSYGGNATISEALGLLEVLKWEMLMAADAEDG